MYTQDTHVIFRQKHTLVYDVCIWKWLWRNAYL